MKSLYESLVSIGFESLAAQVYVLLVEKGEMTVSQIKKDIGLSRTSIYEAFTYLLAYDFVEYRKQGRNALYKANHPNKIFGSIEQKHKDFELEEQRVKNDVKTLIGMYNLANKKPGIRYYEGKESFWQLYNETLESRDIVYTIENEEAAIATQGSMEHYDKDRAQKKITQYIIVPDTPAGRALKSRTENDPYTQVRILPSDKPSFKSTIDLFGGKLLIATQRSEEPIMVVIEDPDIYQMQRQVFEMLWSSLK